MGTPDEHRSSDLAADAIACVPSPQSPVELLPVNDLNVIQDMIDISADRLEGLRTQCVTSATLTQQEIRSLEAKLVRMFSELLLMKLRLGERIPANGLPYNTGSELKLWLRVVGLSQESLNVCLMRLSTLEQLLEQTDDELKQLLYNNPGYREEEVRRLTKAMHNLRKCKEAALNTNTTAIGTAECKDQHADELFWDSWDRHHNHHHHHHRSSVGSTTVVTASPRSQRVATKSTKPPHQQQQQYLPAPLVQPTSANDVTDNKCGATMALSQANGTGSGSSVENALLALTITPSPPVSPITPPNLSMNYGSGGSSLNATPAKAPTHRTKSRTPPPIKKHQTLLSTTQPLTPTHSKSQKVGVVTVTPISKSKSHESQFHEMPATAVASSPSSQIYPVPAGTFANNVTTITTRSRLHTDPSPDSYSSASSDTFMENVNNLQVPRSPCTPIVSLGMGHTISHRFTKVFKVMSTCDLCQKQMFFGLKCKECKYRCHKDCEANVTPSCGLPREFVDEFKKTLKDQEAFSAMTNSSVGSGGPNTSPTMNVLNKNRRRGGIKNATNSLHQPDSSSQGSSCNSSSPSSPALFNVQQQLTQISGYNSSTAMSNSGGGSSTTSVGTISNVLPTPSSFHKNSCQFNFPDVTITSNFNQAAGGCITQTLFKSHSGGGNGDISANSNANAVVNANAIVNVNDFIVVPKDYPDSVALKTLNESSAIPSTHSSQLPANSIVNSKVNCNTVSMVKSPPSIISGPKATTATVTFYGRRLSSAGVQTQHTPNPELSDTRKSNDSDKTVSLSGSTSASTDSDRTPVRLDSTEDGDSGNWPRQNSLSLKEWDIPYSDLCLLEKIGKGRFGTVHRALWHGDVAVKLLKEDYLDDERTLEAFKLEVANFKKTRHENLVLFMGACMNPPYLAIVTSLCKGNTLYTYIHSRRDKFTINRTALVAQQISQGMGYLHARGIFHKDLRTKNIFLENGKVIITDFGLFSSTKLQYCDIGLGVPNGWLCYLSPELMRALKPCKPNDEILPFSKASDVYSFGTVWYELLCGEFPYKTQPPESVIWQVGRGMKQTLANLQTSRDVKDILMLSWSFQADDRPDFPKLLTLLERLPKKRLARSPSHPVQLSRSAESVF